MCVCMYSSQRHETELPLNAHLYVILIKILKWDGSNKLVHCILKNKYLDILVDLWASKKWFCFFFHQFDCTDGWKLKPPLHILHRELPSNQKSSLVSILKNTLKLYDVWPS